MKKDLHKIFTNQESEKVYREKDSNYWKELKEIIKRHNLDYEEIFTYYPSFIRRRDMTRFLTYYELYKLIANIPGSIVDLGIYRGAGFFNWINLFETFSPGDRVRKVFGFDHFEGFKDFEKDKGDDSKDWLLKNNKEGILEQGDEDLIQSLLELHNKDSFLPGVERGSLIVGDICKTVPEFYKNNMGTRLSLLYFDVNLYAPTKVALDKLYDLVLPGGIIAFNGYTAAPWEGEAKAIEDFCNEREISFKFSKFNFSPIPRAYAIKERM